MPTPPEMERDFKKAMEKREVVKIGGIELWYPDFGMSIKIFSSGWKDKYCVVYEDGPYDSCEVLLKGEKQIKETFGIDVKEAVDGRAKA